MEDGSAPPQLALLGPVESWRGGAWTVVRGDEDEVPETLPRPLVSDVVGHRRGCVSPLGIPR